MTKQEIFCELERHFDRLNISAKPSALVDLSEIIETWLEDAVLDAIDEVEGELLADAGSLHSEDDE